MKHGLLNRVVFGYSNNNVVEGLVLDEESCIPWQISKVTVEYKPVDYVSLKQPYSYRAALNAVSPVSPKTVYPATGMGVA